MKDKILLATVRLMEAAAALRTDKKGVTIIEYALLATLVAVALVAALGTLKTSISTSLSTIGNNL